MISDETRSKVEKVREMYGLGINIQETGEATNAIVTGMLKALFDHIDELEADLKCAVAVGKMAAAMHRAASQDLAAGETSGQVTDFSGGASGAESM